MSQLDPPLLSDDPHVGAGRCQGNTLDSMAQIETADTVAEIAVPEPPARVVLSPEIAHAIHRDGPRHAPGTPAEVATPIAPGGNRRRTYLFAKRTMDIVVASALLVLLSPVLLAVLLALAVTTRGRPIFRQERLGHCGRPFRMYKFRTMVLDAERIRHLVRNEQRGPVFKNVRDPRVTRLGRILRSTSLDEVPQLVNVLLGQMSLVGPRPPLASEVAQYEPWQLRRLSVKPGLTCRWQVSGRSEIGFDDWMLLDLWYVEAQGLTTDVVLLLRTPWAVLSRRGAY